MCRVSLLSMEYCTEEANCLEEVFVESNGKEGRKHVDRWLTVLGTLPLGYICPQELPNKVRKMANTMGSIGSSGRLSTEENEEEDISRLAISKLQAKEEQIERKKMEVREKVELQLGRAEEETRRLTQIWEELEVLADPLRKEVGIVRKKIDMTNRELKPLGQSCLKKEKEYKEALEAFNEKSKEKSQLVTTMMEMLSESEKLRMKKLEELNRIMESTT